jgi:hypothetical protein
MDRRGFMGLAGMFAANLVLGPREALATIKSMGRDRLTPNILEEVAAGQIQVEKRKVYVDSKPYTMLVLSKDAEQTPLRYFAPHGDEPGAFLAGVRSLSENGGALIAFQNEGSRNLISDDGINSGVDANRFLTHESRFAFFATAVLKELFRDISEQTVIIGLHNNHPETRHGKGSFLSIVEGGAHPKNLQNDPEHPTDIVWIGGTGELAECAFLTEALDSAGINWLYEQVKDDPKLSGSASQVVSAYGVPYVNIEASLRHGEAVEAAVARQVHAVAVVAKAFESCGTTGSSERQPHTVVGTD